MTAKKQRSKPRRRRIRRLLFTALKHSPIRKSRKAAAKKRRLARPPKENLANSDRRRSRRMATAAALKITRASGEVVEAHLSEVSLLGCRFTSTERFAVGETVAATLTFHGGGTHLVEGTIQHASHWPPHAYGVRFTPQTIERMIKTSVRNES